MQRLHYSEMNKCMSSALTSQRSPCQGTSYYAITRRAFHQRSQPLSNCCFPKKFQLVMPLSCSEQSKLFEYRNGSQSLKKLHASSSSFTKTDGGYNTEASIVSDNLLEHVDESDCEGTELLGMANAFSISQGMANGIISGIALAACILPPCMLPVTIARSLQLKCLSYLTLLFGFYMAWNIGANDVANAMGTSVGSGALSLRQAVLVAAILEFSGAFLVGSHVSHTMQNGILVSNIFAGSNKLLFSGMVSSLAAAGTWLQVASSYGWPVSTTHCIIGAIVGFGLAYGGLNAVYWKSLARVVSSWVVSPLLGGIASFVVYKCIRMFVYSASQPGEAAAAVAPLAVFIGVSCLSFTSLPSNGNPIQMAVQALGCGLLGAILMASIIQVRLGSLLGRDSTVGKGKQLRTQFKRMSFLAEVEGPTGTQLKIVYGIFGYLQVLSACFMSFAHGANDVANAIGPISAALAILHGNGSAIEASLGGQVLAWGGFGIVAGLLVWGYRVMSTIGKKITELTPTRGFAAEFAAASVVIGASRLGLPISATHTLVGAVMGVGFARGLNNVRIETVREIVTSWLVTIPVGAALSIGYTFILMRVLPEIL